MNDDDGMISVEEARERILDVIQRLPAVSMPLADALGHVLAEDVYSPLTIPPLDNTAMDGYAVRAADTDGASPDSPVTLSVIGEVAAGYIYDGEVQPGTAVRIMTGAPIPRGADSVVPFEETDETAGRVFGRFAKGRDHVGVFKAARAREQRAQRRRRREGAAAWSCAPARSFMRRRSACWRRWAKPTSPSIDGRSSRSSRPATSCSSWVRRTSPARSTTPTATASPHW